MEVWKIIFLSKWVICRFHVNLPGCTHPHHPRRKPRVSRNQWQSGGLHGIGAMAKIAKIGGWQWKVPTTSIQQRRDCIIWLVVSTPLKNISQIGNLPQIGMKIKNI